MKLRLKKDCLAEIQAIINRVEGTATARSLAANEVFAIVQNWMHEAHNPSKSVLVGVELEVHAPDYKNKTSDTETIAYLKHDKTGWYVYDVRRVPVSWEHGVWVTFTVGLTKHFMTEKIWRGGFPPEGFLQRDTP